MDVWKSLKPFRPLYIFVLLLVLFAGLLFYVPSNSIQRFLSLKTQYELEREELGKVLKSASMPDRTVLLTTLNGAWASPGSILDLFLESFRVGEGTPKLLNHLVIVAMDEKAYIRCKSIHPHCFSLRTPGVNFTSEERFMTPDYLKLVWRKIAIMHTVLELGYNFVFTDADIMWFRNPFSYFNNTTHEFEVACDYYKRNRANTGLIHVTSTDVTIKFFKYWYEARILHPNLHDQAVFDIIKLQPIVAKTGMKINYLDTMNFGGFCEPSKDMNKVCTMHANCCVGIENKIYDLKLILGDWKNFTGFSHKNKYETFQINSTFLWRAPFKCRQSW